ncbi:acetyltransferase [Adhaeribacter arboris]|uniref:Acetyltransferase n=1 Tax=Adhaeribacter arboris TaxID=2072846 RepID=A0A2T2YKW7_9BACT|nr:NeuD/PglB/VioB family sugar acetyltransferase [Adhaeribacter arboris]PSR56148.1 acetyltransferase [Adhaeribacter arboris]
MQNPVIILGAQKLGIAALDIFLSNHVIVYCFLDDEVKLHQTEVNGITIMGTTDDPEFLKILGKKCEVFVAAEETATRKSLINLLKDEYQVIPVNAIHKFTSVSEHAWLGHGNLINAGAVVNANARINNNCIIHSNALVDSGAKIADFVQIGAGANVGSDVEVEESAFIGAGAVVVAGVKIGKKARVGAGAVVVADVPANQTVFGNPAQKV